MLSFLLCLQIAAPAPDSVYATQALRRMVEGAATANSAPPPSLQGYSARVETELGLLVRDTLGREHTAEIEQLATAVRWHRGEPYSLHVVGYRSQSVGVPYSTLSLIQGWTVPSLYGNRLLLGAYFAGGTRGTGGDTLIAVHPFAADRERYYRYAGGDTVATLRAGNRLIRIVRIRVKPHLHGNERLSAFDGEIDLDADRLQIVRMRGQFVVLGERRRQPLAARLLGVVAVAYVEFVNAEVHGRYWLPSFQRTEFQASISLLGQTRPVYRVVSRFNDLQVDEDSTAADTAAFLPRLAVSWAPSDSISAYHDWIAGIGEQTAAVHADDFQDMAPDAWSSRGPPRLDLFPNSTARILRFNRVEGLFTGAAPSVDFRSLAPGLRIGANAGWAWSEKTIRGGAFASYERANSTFGARAERMLATTNDFALPLSEDPGLGALLSSIDNYDYVDRRQATLSWNRILRNLETGLLTVQVAAARDDYDRARLTRGPLGGAAFEPNRGVDPGTYGLAQADLELHPNVTGDFVTPGAGAKLHYETGAGDLTWQRAELGLSHRAYVGPISLASHIDAGIVVGKRLPPQRLFEIGGVETLPGYDYKQFAGDRAALARTFISYRSKVLKRPIHLWRSLFVPGLSPGVAASAQGGWAEISSDSAKASVARLGLKNGAPISSATGGFRATVGFGPTFFADAVHIGVARPVDHAARWRIVVGFGPSF